MAPVVPVPSSAGPPPRGGDPGKRLVEDISDQVDRLGAAADRMEQRIAPVLAEIQAARAEMTKAGRRPLLTSNQIQDDLLPGLLTAFEGLRALATVLLLMVGIGVGMGVRWWMEPTLICGASMEGRPLCYRWDGPAPPKPAPPAAEAPQQPVPAPPPAKAASVRKP